VARVEISRSQRAYILDRDSYYCQFPIRHTETTYRPCRWSENLEVHHVTPYRWAQERLGWELEEINHPLNLVTVCRHHHRRVLHPDLYQAQLLYGELGKEAFELVFSYRRQLTAQGVPYWYTAYDQLLKRIAQRLTTTYQEAGHQWEPKNQNRRRLAS